MGKDGGEDGGGRAGKKSSGEGRGEGKGLQSGSLDKRSRGLPRGRGLAPNVRGKGVLAGPGSAKEEPGKLTRFCKGRAEDTGKEQSW